MREGARERGWEGGRQEGERRGVSGGVEGEEEERPLEVVEEVDGSSMGTADRELIPVELPAVSEGGSSNTKLRFRQKTTPQK